MDEVQKRTQELIEELEEDKRIEGEANPIVTIADMTSAQVEEFCQSHQGNVSILMQLFGGLLAGLHPIREGEITISDQDIRAAASKLVTIDRFKDFFLVKLVEEED
jgi:hypothetical protein